MLKDITKPIIISIILLLSINIADATVLRDRVLQYREQGFAAQQKGDLDKAQEFYQKVVQLDPYHAVTYNDLGVVYEAKGRLKLAEDSYLKAIQINSDFLSPYYNLGCLYENLGDYNKAVKYLRKRVDLGDPSEVWTQKAKDRLVAIEIIINPSLEEPIEEEIPEEVVSAEKEIEVVKEIIPEVIIKRIIIEEKVELVTPAEPKPEPVPLYKQREIQDLHFKRARKAYEEEDYLTADLEASKALQLDPYNKEAEELFKKSHRKFLVD